MTLTWPRVYRLRAGLSARAAAKRLNLSEGYLRRLEAAGGPTFCYGTALVAGRLYGCGLQPFLFPRVKPEELAAVTASLPRDWQTLDRVRKRPRNHAGTNRGREAPTLPAGSDTSRQAPAAGKGGSP